MAISGLSLRDREYDKFVDAAGGTAINVAIAGGSIVIGSVSASVDDVYINSGDNLNLGSAWKGVGSTFVTNPTAVGSIAVQDVNVLGSIIIGSVTANVDAIYVQSGDNININSMGSAWNNVGSVLVSNPNVVWAGVGSTLVTNPTEVGSLAVQDVNVLGSIIIGSVTANVDSVYVQSGNVNTGIVTPIGSNVQLWSGSPATEVPLVDTNRRNINLTVETSGVAYVGFDSGVLTTDGYPMRQFDSLSMDIGSTSLYAYTETGSVDMRVIQIIEG
jgi:hypothetical protein